jgi:hypothetical protein
MIKNQFLFFCLSLLLLIFICGCKSSSEDNSTATKQPEGNKEPTSITTNRKEGMNLHDFIKQSVAETMGEKTKDSKERFLKEEVYSEGTMLDIVVIADANKDKPARVAEINSNSLKFFKYISSDKEIQGFAKVTLIFRNDEKSIKNICSVTFKKEKLTTVDWNNTKPEDLEKVADDYFKDIELN